MTIITKVRCIGGLDYLLFSLMLLLVGIGIAVQYSAANGSWFPWAIKQSVYLVISLTIFFFIYLLPGIRESAYKLYGTGVLLLIAVVVMGETRMGATRWINVGVLNFQPSELAKIGVILALSRYICDMNLSRYSPLRFFIIPVFMVILPVLFVFVQPHLGNSVLICITGFGIIFVAGFPVRAILFLIVSFVPCIPLAWIFLLKPYQKIRVISFLHPERDPLGAGYNVIQSEIAVGSGGVFGKGFLEGSQTHLGFLPEKHTDFVFTIIAEEFGFSGCAIVLLLYTLLIYRLYRIIHSSTDHFVRLVVFGIQLSLSVQIIMNIFMTLGLMPVVGVPLPLISYGGSSLMISAMSIAVACGCGHDTCASGPQKALR